MKTLVSAQDHPLARQSRNLYLGLLMHHQRMLKMILNAPTLTLRRKRYNLHVPSLREKYTKE